MDNNFTQSMLDGIREQEEAKNKFFELFSKIFYALWD